MSNANADAMVTAIALSVLSYRRAKNQRTSGPVNAHLTPGLGIYFNAFIHVYSPRAKGQTTPWGQMLMSTESPYHFAHLLPV